MTDELVSDQVRGRRSGDALRWQDAPAQIFSAAGWVSIMTGGLVAALASPLALDHGSWLAAYLVLVGGVGQVVMAWALGWTINTPRSRWANWVQLGSWNLGNLAVMGGTLLGQFLLVGLGSIVLLVALVIALGASRHGMLHGSRPALRLPDRVARRAYQVALLLLLASVPIGVLVSYLRHH